ncbi:MAG: hypothetical protein AAF567_02480 [Actinomycetota bacterium]
MRGHRTVITLIVVAVVTALVTACTATEPTPAYALSNPLPATPSTTPPPTTPPPTTPPLEEPAEPRSAPPASVDDVADPDLDVGAPYTFGVEARGESILDGHRITVEQGGRRAPVTGWECFDIETVEDFDSDGYDEALLWHVASCEGGGCCGTAYSFLDVTSDGEFVLTDRSIRSVYAPEWARDDGQWVVTVRADPAREATRLHEIIQRFALERSELVVLEEFDVPELEALVEIRSSFDGDQELAFDLSGNGAAEIIRCNNDRDIRHLVRCTLGSGTGNPRDLPFGGDRVGVLSTRTDGWHDLVVDLDRVFQWDRFRYVPAPLPPFRVDLDRPYAFRDDYLGTYFGEGAQIVVEQGGRVQTAISWECADVYMVEDFDADGHDEALVRHSPACGGNGSGSHYSFVDVGSDGTVHATERSIGSYIAPEATQIDGRWQFTIVNRHQGYNTTLKRTTQVFTLADSELVVLSQIVGVELPAIAEIRSETMAETTLAFDLDADGSEEALTCGYWDRWGSFSGCTLETGTGEVLELGIVNKRVGVLESTTRGWHDLVIGIDGVMEWDGANYVWRD